MYETHVVLTNANLGEVVGPVAGAAVAREAALAVAALAGAAHVVHDLALVHVHARAVRRVLRGTLEVSG